MVVARKPGRCLILRSTTPSSKTPFVIVALSCLSPKPILTSVDEADKTTFVKLRTAAQSCCTVGKPLSSTCCTLVSLLAILLVGLEFYVASLADCGAGPSRRTLSRGKWSLEVHGWG